MGVGVRKVNAELHSVFAFLATALSDDYDSSAGNTHLLVNALAFETAFTANSGRVIADTAVATLLSVLIARCRLDLGDTWALMWLPENQKFGT